MRLALRLHSLGHGAAEQQRYEELTIFPLHSSPIVKFLMFPHPTLLYSFPLRSQMRLQCAESARSGLLQATRPNTMQIACLCIQFH